MFLIDNHEAEVGEWQEHCRPRADYELAGVAAELPPPDAEPLGIGQPRVVDQLAVAEEACEPARYLGGQGYLGQHIEDLLALVEHLGYEVDVDFGLA